MKVLKYIWAWPPSGSAVIVVGWPICREQTFVTPTHGGSTNNLVLIGRAVSDIFEQCGQRMDDERRMDAGAWYTISSPGEPVAQVSSKVLHYF